MTNPNMSSMLAQARDMYRNGDIAQARDFVKRALAYEPNNVEAWLLVTYLTSDPSEQQNALDRAKLVEPQNARILKREQALFGQRKTTERFVPDNINLPRQTVESRGSARSDDLATPKSPDRLPSQLPQSVPRPSQPSSQQRSMSSGEHIPTLADGVVLKRPLNLSTYLPIMVVLGGVAACMLLAVGYNAVMQSRFQRLPNATVLTSVSSNTVASDSIQSGIAQSATTTTMFQTQIAVTVTQQAIAFKGTLKGTIATSKNINGQPRIVMMNADGSNLKVLSEIGVDPAWSPDGTHLAFVNREHGYWVHVMASDGTSDTELNGPGLDFAAIGYPTWSPDGRRLMFEANRQFARRVLVISGVNGSGLTQVLNGDQAGGFHSWSPDGTQVLYTRDDQIWLANVTGAVPRSILTQAGIQEAAWSPDAQQLAFDAGNNTDRGLYVMNTDGSNLRRITSKAIHPALTGWSPDGKYIAAQCYDVSVRSNNLCVMNVDGTSLTYITTGGGFDGRIAWKP